MHTSLSKVAEFYNIIFSLHLQVWQKRWEMFNDPLNKEVVDDGRRSPGTARSVTSVRNIWMKPESYEQAEVDSVWEKVAVQLTNLRKPAKPGENQQHR